MNRKILFAIALGFGMSVILAGCNDGGSKSGDGLCPNPIVIEGSFDPGASGYIVQLMEGADPVAEANRLSQTYGFAVGAVYTDALRGFFAEISPSALERIRCESVVSAISYNGLVRPVSGG